MIWLPVVLSVLFWAWLLVGHGGFWRSSPSLPRAETLRAARVTAVIPARNEALYIGETLRSLLLQITEGTLHILLVDDNSTDGTGAVAQELAELDNRIRVVQGAPLPEGWTGKLWAVSQGLNQPEALAADYVLLTDADIVHEAGHLQSLLAFAEHTGVGLLSEMVHLRNKVFAERSMLPAFVFFFQLLYPFHQVNDPTRSIAAAAGGCMLLRRDVLDSVDGVDRIRGELIDDVALARQVKSAGFRIWLGHGEDVHSRRQYPYLDSIWEMIARTAYVQLRYSPLLLAATCIGMLLLYLEPVLSTLFATGIFRWAGIFCWLAMALAFQPTLHRYRRSPLWGLALPFIALFYLGATCDSAVRFYRGQGGRWKGRTYPVRN